MSPLTMFKVDKIRLAGIRHHFLGSEEDGSMIQRHLWPAETLAVAPLDGKNMTNLR